QTRRQIPDGLDGDGLDTRGTAPVVLPGLKHHLYAHFLADEFKGSSTHGACFESLLPHLLIVMLGNNPANTVRRAIEEVQEVDERLLKVKDDGAVINDFNMVEFVTEDFEVEPFVLFVRPFDICRSEWMTIM